MEQQDINNMSDRELKKSLKEAGYKGKLNKVYKGEDGNMYFDMTPSYLKKMMQKTGKVAKIDK